MSAGLRLVVVLVVELPGAVVRHGVEKVLHLRRALALNYHAFIELVWRHGGHCAGFRVDDVPAVFTLGHVEGAGWHAQRCRALG